MNNLLGFMDMYDDYETRKVDRDEFPWGMISTVQVSDGSKPYETAVDHDKYGSDMVIVEHYNTKKEAQIGHNKWVGIMTSDNLPDTLEDCNNSGIAQLISSLGGNSNKSKKA